MHQATIGAEVTGQVTISADVTELASGLWLSKTENNNFMKEPKINKGQIRAHDLKQPKYTGNRVTWSQPRSMISDDL